jgi:hypothetical protein
LIKFFERWKSLSPNGYELWSQLPQFEWGHRPGELSGTTSMKAVFKEFKNTFYFGETLIVDSSVRHGKGISIMKTAPYSIYEVWFDNDNANGKGRMINNDKHIYEGDWANNFSHG